MSTHSKHYADLVVRGETIRQFEDMDLASLVDFPTRQEQVVALSIRIDAAFKSVWKAGIALIPERYEELPRELIESLMTELALGFVERYGILALLSKDLLTILWKAQRLNSVNGPKRLRQLGQNLSNFVLACKGMRPRKTIDVTFKLFKPGFLAELKRLSRELGESKSCEPWVDQLLGFVSVGEYPMLKLNLSFLQQFLKSRVINRDLGTTNAAAADQLAEYGIGRVLGERRKSSMTPDRFFYVWIGWITNKRLSTVRREVQTAESVFKKKLNEKIRGTNNR